MTAKRKQKKAQQRNHRNRAKPQSTPKLSHVPTASATPEQLIGAIVESIAPPLFETGLEEASDSPSGIHAIPPRGEEHRAHTRVPVAVAIGLETESHFFAGLSGDLSEGGVFVQTYRDLPVGSDVDLRFELPEGELTAQGRVRWHRASSDSSPPGVGIAFEELSERDRGMIARFCEQRAPLYYEVEHA